MPTICVLGSLNVDLTVTMPRFHQPGETITGSDFQVFTGGKGGNQAVATARLGADIRMLGCVGDDANGHMYMDALKSEGVDVSRVQVLPGVPTGVALIEVEQATAENRIVIVAGANGEVDCDVVSGYRDALGSCAACLLQLETPLVSVNHAAAIVRQAGGLVILDPAPARPLPEALISLCDYITPNETELQLLTGRATDTVEHAVEAARILLDRGARAVVNKRGKQGALLVTKDGHRLFPGFSADAVDTTAAGDSFNAGLAVGLTMGYAPSDAIILANAVGALSTTAMGAQSAMPRLDDALGLIAQTDL